MHSSKSIWGLDTTVHQTKLIKTRHSTGTGWKRGGRGDALGKEITLRGKGETLWGEGTHWGNYPGHWGEGEPLREGSTSEYIRGMRC